MNVTGKNYLFLSVKLISRIILSVSFSLLFFTVDAFSEFKRERFTQGSSANNPGSGRNKLDIIVDYRAQGKNPTALSKSGRYFVKLKTPAVLDRAPSGGSRPSFFSRLTEVQREQDDFVRNALPRAKVSPQKVKTRISKVHNLLIMALKEEEQKAILDLGYEIYPEHYLTMQLDVSVPLIQAPNVWGQVDASLQPITGKGIRVAIIDSGIDYTHPAFGGCSRDEFLTGNCSKVIAGYDFIDEDFDPSDVDGHGTHVGGIVAANGILRGVAPDATLVAYRVCGGPTGACPEGAILEALERSIDPNNDGDTSDRVDIINMSLGSSSVSIPFDQSVNNATSAGVLVVTAVGNSGLFGAEPIGSPASAESALTVGATYARDYPQSSGFGARQDQIAYFSLKGPTTSFDGKLLLRPNVVAPGSIICAPKSSQATFEQDYLCADGNYVILQGTSMASPHVAGLAALLKQKNPTWSPKLLREAIQESSKIIQDPLSALEYDPNTQGFGRIRADKAIEFSFPRLDAEIVTFGEIVATPFSVIGTAAGEDFDFFRLSIKGVDEENWNVVAEKSEPIVQGVLASITLDQLDAGVATIKLEVFSQQNQSRKRLEVVNFIGVEILQPQPVNGYPFSQPDSRIYPGHTPIQIMGTAQSGKFDRFEIEWCVDRDRNPGECSTNGVTLIENGRSPVYKNLLGVWNPNAANVPSGAYHLRIRRFDTDGKTASTEPVMIYVDRMIKPGFPVQLSAPCSNNLSTAFRGSPLLANLGGSASPEIIVGGNDKIAVLAENGSNFPGWPHVLSPHPAANRTPVIIGVAAADTNGDGKSEVVVTDNESRIFNLASDASLLWQRDFRSTAAYGSIPSIRNFLPNGLLQIIFGLQHFYSGGPGYNSIGIPSYYVLDTSGMEASAWPIEILPSRSYAMLSPYGGGEDDVSVADLDGDGINELVVIGKACQLALSGNVYGCVPAGEATFLNVLDPQGKTKPGWPRIFSGREGMVTLADLNLDSRPEMLFKTLDHVSATTSVHVVDFSTATEVSGWPRVISGWNLPDEKIIPGDLDGDGSTELVTIIDTCLYVFNSTGEIRAGWPRCPSTGIGFALAADAFGRPVLANLDQDSDSEILVWTDTWSAYTTSPYLRAIGVFNEDGSAVNGFQPYVELNTFAMPRSFAVGDLDGNGTNELLACAGSNMYAWDLGSCAMRSEIWPQDGRDAAHSNLYIRDTLTPSCQQDSCPADALKQAPGLCGCGVSDIDSDGDSIPDCMDACPVNKEKLLPGVCTCGVLDIDSDYDGVLNCVDQCPLDFTQSSSGDSDGDGVIDCIDLCPNDPRKTDPGECGCGLAENGTIGDNLAYCVPVCFKEDPEDPTRCLCYWDDIDSDNDGHPDCADACPMDRFKAHPSFCGCNAEELLYPDGRVVCRDTPRPDTRNPLRPKKVRLARNGKKIIFNLERRERAKYKIVVERLRREGPAIFLEKNNLRRAKVVVKQFPKGRFRVRYQITESAGTVLSDPPFSRWKNFKI